MLEKDVYKRQSHYGDVILLLNQLNIFIEAAKQGYRLFHAVNIDTLFCHSIT